MIIREIRDGHTYIEMELTKMDWGIPDRCWGFIYDVKAAVPNRLLNKVSRRCWRAPVLFKQSIRDIAGRNQLRVDEHVSEGTN